MAVLYVMFAVSVYKMNSNGKGIGIRRFLYQTYGASEEFRNPDLLLIAMDIRFELITLFRVYYLY